MADNTQSAPNQPSEPDFSYTSFSNPNYSMEGQDQSPTEEEEPLSIGQLSVTDGSAADKPVYPNSDYSSAANTPSSPDRSFVLQKLKGPDTEDNDTDDDTSSLEDDSEMTHNLLDSREDLREEATYMAVTEDGGKKGRGGILGYLAMLEQQAKGGVIKLKRPESPDDGLGARTPDDVDAGEMPTTANHLVSICKLEINTDLNSPDSQDSGIQPDKHTLQHIHAPITDDIYAIVEKKAQKIKMKIGDSPENEKDGEEKKEEEEEVQQQVLPPGWQKHEDEDGPYYWHVKSGTIQRDTPPPAPPDGPTLCNAATVRSLSLTSDSSSQGASSVPSSPTSVASTTERLLRDVEGHALQFDGKSRHPLRQAEAQASDGGEEKDLKVDAEPARFSVCSMGCLPIAEEDLSPDRSSKAVNKCIMDLSAVQTDVIVNTVGRWGEGQEIYMDIDCSSLRLIDPSDSSVLHSQPIHSIRVWGVGRDNGRDFAYVARDRTTRTHMCHVFHCEMPARQIASTLRDICKRIMHERGIHMALREPRVSRPTDLPELGKLNQQNSGSVLTSTSFPTPMEEPRKVIRCHYLGCREVGKPTGMDIINESVDWMYYQVPAEKWIFVDVAIAPSTITITEHENPDNILEECRVRFMSFMGISIANVKLCAFVMHMAQNKFVSHVFHCEPSGGPMCKTIEAACKLRYQKCLDSHPPKSARGAKGVGAALKAGVKASVQGVQNILGLIKNKGSHGAGQTRS